MELSDSLWDVLEDTWLNVYNFTQQASCPSQTQLTEKQPSTSLSFFPGARGSESNVVFHTVDSVVFYVDTDIIFRVSRTAFHGELKSVDIQGTSPAIINIPETSLVLDVMLHILYRLAFTEGTPLPQYVIEGIGRLSKYGIDPVKLLTTANPCYDDILNLVPLFPLQMYTLAAKLNIHHMAVTASSHLLSHPLEVISDEMAEEMGPFYLQQLFVLHAHRRDKLKSIMEKPPHPHAPTTSCDFDEQKKLCRAWTMVSGYFIWDFKCDFTPKAIQLPFEDLDKHLKCELCRGMLEERVKEVIAQWILVKGGRNGEVRSTSDYDVDKKWKTLATIACLTTCPEPT